MLGIVVWSAGFGVICVTVCVPLLGVGRRNNTTTIPSVQLGDVRDVFPTVCTLLFHHLTARAGA